MQLELLATSESSADEAPACSSDLERAAPPTIGEKFAQLFAGYLAAVEAWASDLSRLSALEQIILPCESYMAAMHCLDAYDADKLRQKAANDIRGRIIRHAEKRFAPTGGTLSIDQHECDKAFPVERDSASDFDPAAFWSYLEKKYGGSVGQEIAWRQAAGAVVSAFNLRDDKPVQSKGGYVVLTRRIWLDDLDKKYGKNRLSYSCTESVSDAIKALIGFASWNERSDLGRDLRDLRSHFLDRSYNVESRKRYDCGENGEVVVVTFQTSFEYRIREDVAAQLNIFVGTYGTVGD